jgi:transcription elongation factor Elf1
MFLRLSSLRFRSLINNRDIVSASSFNTVRSSTQETKTKVFQHRHLSDKACVEGQDGSSDILVDLKARMHIAFTCKICGTRSAHEMTKIAYTQGVVLVQCPGCEKQHLIADNLGWFGKDKQY